MPKIVLETTKCQDILATSPAGDSILPDLMEKPYSYVTPDLTGQVVQTSAHPIFEGTYSNIFNGKWNGSKVAIKAIRRVDSLENMQRKLRREREVWGGLKHPNVVPLYGYCEEFGALGSLISPWYENGDVGTFVRERPTCALQRLQWLRNIIDGLVHLHSHDPIVVHGDLKPANALIDDEGRARLCDFGLVRVLSEGRKTGYTTGANHTGTVRYLSYELVKPEKPDEQVVSTTASDVHAIGCIALEILFLQLPYATHQHVGHIYGDISKGVSPAIELPWIGVPPPAVEDLWGMIVGCWNTDPTARPSAAQLQEYMQDHEDDLKEAFRQSTTLALPRSTPNQ
ncbi:kinase-like protein [Serendipita vermifera]|nr:kinase-like protein [Serendipita vermifera]